MPSLSAIEVYKAVAGSLPKAETHSTVRQLRHALRVTEGQGLLAGSLGQRNLAC